MRGEKDNLKIPYYKQLLFFLCGLAILSFIVNVVAYNNKDENGNPVYVHIALIHVFISRTLEVVNMLMITLIFFRHIIYDFKKIFTTPLFS